MVDYLILGNGDYAKMICRYLRETMSIVVSAYTVVNDIINDSYIDGIPVLSTDVVATKYDPKDTIIFMGIGYRKMNQIKANEYIRYKKMGYYFGNYIHPTAIIGNSVEIGEANNVFEGVIIQEGVKIGNANLIYGGAFIAHECIIGSYNTISVKACVAGCTKIGDNCFVGANATIRDHVSINNYTLIGAGAYADVSTEKYNVIAPIKSIILEGKNSVEFI